ncbi:MAG: LacI family DNA-binding transcriptional regulator [Blautia sp.]|nr:LacI family DNA-binding transcriptional regulator [Blautia sp.]
MNIRELAAEIGVSPAAVSIVLNDRPGVSDKTRKKIKEAIDKAGYVPTARKKKVNHQILLLKCVRGEGLLTEENQGFVGMIIDAAMQELAFCGYSPTLMRIQLDTDRVLDDIEFRQYEGVIVIATEIPERQYKMLDKISIPFVCVDNMMPEMQYSCVGIDNEANVQIALNYAVECGYLRIGYLKSAYHAQNFTDRAAAFYYYTQKYQLETRKDDVISLDISMMNAFEEMKEYLDCHRRENLPPCFFADNDTIALGALKAFRHRGYQVPEDVAVIGFDDIPYSAVCSPSLTTVHVSRKLIGQAAARQLIERMKDEEYEKVKTKVSGDLVVRTSMKKTS